MLAPRLPELGRWTLTPSELAKRPNGNEVHRNPRSQHQH